VAKISGEIATASRRLSFVAQSIEGDRWELTVRGSGIDTRTVELACLSPWPVLGELIDKTLGNVAAEAALGRRYPGQIGGPPVAPKAKPAPRKRKAWRTADTIPDLDALLAETTKALEEEQRR